MGSRCSRKTRLSSSASTMPTSSCNSTSTNTYSNWNRYREIPCGSTMHTMSGTYIRIRTCICTLYNMCIHTYIHAYVHGCMHTIGTKMSMNVCASAVCLCACMQAEYMAEGIEWSAVSFVDNQECLDLIAKKPTGLLPLLDEECRSAVGQALSPHKNPLPCSRPPAYHTLHSVLCSFPGADDHSLFQKFERQHKGTSCYHSPQLKLQDPQFTITHYASPVTYNIKVSLVPSHPCGCVCGGG